MKAVPSTFSGRVGNPHPERRGSVVREKLFARFQFSPHSEAIFRLHIFKAAFQLLHGLNKASFKFFC